MFFWHCISIFSYIKTMRMWQHIYMPRTPQGLMFATQMQTLPMDKWEMCKWMCCCYSIRKKQTSSTSALPSYHVYSNEVYLRWNTSLPHNHIFFFKQGCEQLSARTQAWEQMFLEGHQERKGKRWGWSQKQFFKNCLLKNSHLFNEHLCQTGDIRNTATCNLAYADGMSVLWT